MSDPREPDFEQIHEGQGSTKKAAHIADAKPEPKMAEGVRPRARLLPMWILIAAVVVVGVAWALNDRYFGEPETADADVPLVIPEDTPIKLRPEEPGGVEVPNRDKYVYKSLTEEEPDAEQLLPPPEAPMELTTATLDEGINSPVEAAEELEGTAGDLEPLAEAKLEATPESPPPNEVVIVDSNTLASEPEDILPEVPTAEVELITEAPSPPTAVSETVEVVSEASGDPQPGSKPDPSQQPESDPEPIKAAALSSDIPGFLVQIGATRQEDRAASEIARLTKKHPEIFKGLATIVVRADLGEKGVWYRIRVGPLASRAEANATCDELNAVDIGCFVVAN